ncbi:MAG: L,D-transpeptidase family protein [Lachnospiraceae bacterium]|nr:L,D-transpeptidase family protein [Lachnospiraceae bacterium]
MKKRIAIPLAVLLTLTAAGAGGAFYLYSQGPQMTYAPTLVAQTVAANAISWYTDGFDKYKGIFLPGTVINGYDASGMTPDEFTELTIAENRKGTITLKGLDKATEKIRLNDIVKEVTLEKDPASFLNDDDLMHWPAAITQDRTFDDKVTVTYDPEKIAACVNALGIVSGEGVIEPHDAYFTRTEDGFAIVPEVVGNKLDAAKIAETVAASLAEEKYSVDLVSSDCYIKPAVLIDDPSLTTLMEEGDQLRNTVVTIDLTAASETVDWNTFGPWVGWDGSQFTLDTDAMTSYVDDIGKQYETYQMRRQFVNHNGETITVGGSERDTYGFWINTADTVIRLTNAILSRESQTIAAKWRVNALTRNQANGDIGGTYMEISIAEQHMWLYRDYAPVFDSDIVTGLASDPGRQTPTGVFCILSKLLDHTMSGSYGSQTCSYFMAFDWTGCAIHDAWWRDSFGGTIYLEDGSHGCVNTPKEKMVELWDQINTGTPVIIY